MIRWTGAGIEACGRDGGSWAPLAGACWYAIDLLEPAGEVEVSRRRDGRLERALIAVGEYAYPVQHITLQDDSQVNLSAESLARVRREQARVGALWSLDTPVRFSPPLASPLREPPEGGRFGSRRFFNGEPRSPHSGADFSALTGAPVLATADGTVVLADDLFFSGRSVFIDHGGRLISMYFHLSEIAVEEGATVRTGQQIGKVGQSGRATGPHLHFGLRWRGARVDPRLLLEPAETIAEIR